MSPTLPSSSGLPSPGDRGRRFDASSDASSDIGPSSDVPVPLPGLDAGKQFDAVSAPDKTVYRRETVGVGEAASEQVHRRRVWIPILLFLLTCASTFFVGASRWMPTEIFEACLNEFDLMPVRRAIYSHWDDGLIYMCGVIAILLTHEMGHFVMTLVYRVRSSYPFFIPLPISPIGTMGAVIAMDGRKANRKEIFDIGLAGPLAGLVVAIPILVLGTWQLSFDQSRAGGFSVGLPLSVHMLLSYGQASGYQPGQGVAVAQANPLFMAGWVGLLVTGLNMLPVSQLDGGHVTYALLGRRAHWLARAFMLGVFAYMAISGNMMWVIMALLVLMMGTDHPPTSDDTVRLGPVRTVIGWLSLLIPLFCFTPQAIMP